MPQIQQFPTRVITEPSFMNFYNEFEWKYAPLHSFSYPVAASFLYIFCVVVHAFSKKANKQPDNQNSTDLKTVQIAHNLILCVSSLTMVLGTIFEIWRRSIAHEGLYFLLCEDIMMSSSGPLFFWSYVYYLSKYYELLDTALALLRGRPPPFLVLHVYHHACIILVCWAWLEYRTSLQFVGILFNTSVHVVMYYYYYIRLVSGPPRWKKFVTIFQIVQFVCSLVFFLLTANEIWGKGKRCAGANSLIITTVFNATLLVEFVKVYLWNSKTQVKKMA